MPQQKILLTKAKEIIDSRRVSNELYAWFSLKKGNIDPRHYQMNDTASKV